MLEILKHTIPHQTKSSQEGHKDSNRHGESMIIEQLPNKKTTPTEKLKLRWRKKENFWIKNSKTSVQHDLSQGLDINNHNDNV